MDAGPGHANPISPEEQRTEKLVERILIAALRYKTEVKFHHSPGPWTIERLGILSINGPEFEIHPTCTNERPGSRERMLADSYLISAAPDLLAALEELLDRIERAHDEGINTGIGVSNAMVAVDKAKFGDP